MKLSWLPIGIIILLFLSCSTKKRQSFHFGGERLFSVEKGLVIKENIKEAPLILSLDSLRESVVATKDKTESKKGFAHRVAQKRFTRLLKKQIPNTNSTEMYPKKELDDEPKEEPKERGKTTVYILFFLSFLLMLFALSVFILFISFLALIF